MFQQTGRGEARISRDATHRRKLRTIVMWDLPSWGLISGAALMGAAGVRTALDVEMLRRRSRRDLARARQRQGEFTAQLASASQWARASQPALKAWAGLRALRVSAVVDEARDCRSYYLVPEDGRPLPRFEPGQYLTFHLPSGDPARPWVRCYSLSDRPREDYYRVTVKRAGPPPRPPSLPAGRARSYFHREVGPGALLQAEAPQGSFFLDPTDAGPVALLGAGVGVTPIMSMAAALVHQRDARPVYVFLGFRNGREHPFRARLAALRDAGSSFRVHVSYSQPTADDRRAGAFDRQGRIDVDQLRAVLPSNNFRFYVCGPAGLMQSLVPELLAWRVPAEHIRYEAFGPASVRGLGPAEATVMASDVHFARSG
ncbi:MAG TPA: hypothetical protein PKC18_01215, partial [Lacipirellulaceae bacterium]|nr:hypothetical protein [Lacipirellulaceae bacterium]